MTDQIRYVFTKLQTCPYGQPVEQQGVGVIDKEGHQYLTFFLSPEHIKRDPENKSGFFRQIELFVNKQLKKIKVDASLSPTEFLKKIRFDKLYANFDKTVEKQIQKEKDYWQNARIMDAYYDITQTMSRFTPVGIEAMLTGKKYPLATSIHDFLRGVDRTEIQDAINALPADKRKELLKFAKEQNFDIPHQTWREHGWQKIHNSNAYETRAVDLVEFSRKNLFNSEMRLAVSALIDRLKYEYYKKTNNMEVFFTKQEYAKINSMSDIDVAKTYGTWATQFFENALVIMQRIEKIAQEKRDITPFMKELYDISYPHREYYCNQDIIRLFYNTLKNNYNKFKKNRYVDYFMGYLHDAARNKDLKTQIADTFGLEGSFSRAMNYREKLKKKEEKLIKAAERIKSGNVRSGVVIADDIARLYNEYDVVPVDKKKTVKKIQAKKSLSKAQQQIVDRYATNKR